MEKLTDGRLAGANPVKKHNLRAAGTGDVSALLLARGERLDRLDRDGDRVHAERLEKVLGLRVDLEGRVGRDGESRHVGDVLVLALTFLFLQTERDTADGALLDTFHQVGGETRDLVPQALGGDRGDLIEEALVGVEVQGETGVVLLNEHPRSTLDSLRPDATLLFQSESCPFSSEAINR